jgi:hypothetical protein
MDEAPKISPEPAAAHRRHVLFEPLVLVLLSLATVGTAWCSYEAAVWGAVSQRNMNLSARSSRQSVANQFQAYQLATVDILLFSQYVNARATSNETLAHFYVERFRGEAKKAFQEWMATRPFENPNAPPHPFVSNFYQPQALVQSRLDDAESQSLWQQAGDAGRTGRSYILITVMLASALFCGGTAPKLGSRWLRLAVLTLGLFLFIFAATRLWLLPVRL